MLNIPGILVVIWLVFTIACFVRWVVLALDNEVLADRVHRLEQRNEALEEELIEHYRKEIA